MEKTLEQRKIEYKEKIDRMMNPSESFDPDNFEPLATIEEKEVSDRVRIVPPPVLPTFNIKPKEIREGQMIGMYESKQDLYLIFAHRCNELQKIVEGLEERIKKLEKVV